jgi:hypothetical protein
MFWLFFCWVSCGYFSVGLPVVAIARAFNQSMCLLKHFIMSRKHIRVFFVNVV